MKKKIVSEVQIRPVKPNNGLVAFCSFVLFESLYCSSVGIFTRLSGGYRLVYPNRIVANESIDVFHPISKQLGIEIENEVIKKFEEVLNNDRHNRYKS